MEKKLINYVSVPRDCYIILTARCNQRCLHCYGNYGVSVPKNELTGKEWDKVFKNLVDNKVFYINISGGEPTTHPDFIEIMESIKKYKLHFIITTNAIFNNNILNSIISVKDYLIGIKISLDGPDFNSHGFIRRNIRKQISKSDFDRTINNINELKKNNIPFTIASCIHKHNINKFNKFLELILELKPISWFISTISVSGRSKDNLDIFASDSEISIETWSNIKKVCEENNIFVNFIDMPFASKTKVEEKFYYQCPAARVFCEINSDGLVTPCPLSRVSIPQEIIKFDNIKDKNIKEIWNGKEFNKFLELSKIGCYGCNLKDKCDRCIPQSIDWFNDPTMPPPYCIKNGKILGLDNLNELNNCLIKKMNEYSRENYVDIKEAQYEK